MEDVICFPSMCTAVLEIICCCSILAEDEMGGCVRVATGMEAKWEIPVALVSYKYVPLAGGAPKRDAGG